MQNWLLLGPGLNRLVFISFNTSIQGSVGRRIFRSNSALISICLWLETSLCFFHSVTLFQGLIDRRKKKIRLNSALIIAFFKPEISWWFVIFSTPVQSSVDCEKKKKFGPHCILSQVWIEPQIFQKPRLDHTINRISFIGAQINARLFFEYQFFFL